MISITRSFQFNSLTITDVLEETIVTLFTLAIQINFHVVIFINYNCNRTVYSNQLYAIVVLQSLIIRVGSLYCVQDRSTVW